PAAAAANSPFAAAVSPLTPRPGTPRPSRVTAVFRSARSVREVEVEVLMAGTATTAGIVNYRTQRRPRAHAPAQRSRRSQRSRSTVPLARFSDVRSADLWSADRRSESEA